MPELTRFFGIIIYMSWRDHNPPHFHACYGEHEALISLSGKVIGGSLPRRALSLVFEWLAIPAMNCLRIGNWRNSGNL
jgi:hypothetical protein